MGTALGGSFGLVRRGIRKVILGSDLTRTHPDLPRDFGELQAAVTGQTMTSVERLYALHEATRYLHRAAVDGAMIECGVWRGGSSMMIALTLMRLGVTDRELWLYDTFEGMSEPTERDVDLHGNSASDRWGRIRDRPEDLALAYAPLETVQRNIEGTGYPSDLLRYVRGQVEQTIPDQAPDRVALLRLDTDWYESTLHELEHLYPRLARGGVLIIDDYGHFAGAREATDEYFDANPPRPMLTRLDYTGRIAVKV